MSKPSILAILAPWALVGLALLVVASVVIVVVLRRQRHDSTLPGAGKDLEQAIRDVTEWRPPAE